MPPQIDDELEQRPYRVIWRLAWPQVLMMLFHFLIGAVDVKVAGLLNAEVQAALGMMTQLLMFFLVIAIAMSNGAVAAISQSDGAGKSLRVQRYTGLCVLSALGLGLVLLAASFPLRGLLLDIMQVRPGMEDTTRFFLEVYLLSVPSYYLLTITNAIFRAQKRVMFPLYTMMLITVLNGLGDLAFGLGMFGFPALGYRGLAWATLGAVSFGALLNLYMLHRLGLLRARSFAPWRWVRRAFPYLVKVAVPSGMLSAVWNTGYLILFALTSSLPVDAEGARNALAGLTVGNRIEALLFLPALAFNMTAGILVGHYLGAGRPDLAKSYGYRVLGIGMVSVSLVTLLLWQFIGPITGYFSADVGVQAQTVSYLMWNMLAIPFTLVAMILTGALNGAGASLYTFLVMGGSIWFVRLPLAWILGHQLMEGPTGIWIAMLCSQAAAAVTVFWVYARTDWPRFSMIKPQPRRVPNGTPFRQTPH
ncbi:MAG: MATE family efflux transporter [Desulfovibrio sp.]